MSVNQFHLLTPLAQNVLGVIQERIVKPNDEFAVADIYAALADTATVTEVDRAIHECWRGQWLVYCEPVPDRPERVMLSADGIVAMGIRMFK